MIGLGLGLNTARSKGKNLCDYAYVSLMVCSPAEVTQTPLELCNKDCYEKPVKIVTASGLNYGKSPSEIIYLGDTNYD